MLIELRERLCLLLEMSVIQNVMVEQCCSVRIYVSVTSTYGLEFDVSLIKPNQSGNTMKINTRLGGTLYLFTLRVNELQSMT